MRLVWAILAKQNLPKFLWVEITKAIVYLCNQNPIYQDTTTKFENLKSKKPYCGYLFSLRYQVWVWIFKKKKKTPKTG